MSHTIFTVVNAVRTFICTHTFAVNYLYELVYINDYQLITILNRAPGTDIHHMRGTYICGENNMTVAFWQYNY